MVDSRGLWRFAGSDGFLLRKVLRLYGMEPERFLTSFMLKLMGWSLQRSKKGELTLKCFFCGACRLLSAYPSTPTDAHSSEG